MSDLSPIIANSTDWFIDQINQIRMAKYAGRYKPHKLVMLLAVVDLAEDGLLKENRVYLDEPLLDRFEKYFDMLASEGDWNQPGMPFFHLRSSEFWFLRVKIGRERFYKKMKRVGGGLKRITENIEYAYLDDRAFMALNDPKARRIIYDFIRYRIEELSHS